MADTPLKNPHRTRIKICGLTREADVDAAVQAGADAIGFVLYEKSPRAVSLARAVELAQRLPVFVTPVLLLVNQDTPNLIALRADSMPASGQFGSYLLQFHGDESPAHCAAAGMPFMRAARIPLGGEAGFDLVKFSEDYHAAQAILVDAHVEGYGGGGKTFDWTALPWSHPTINASSRIVLSGGLSPANVGEAIDRVRPWAVDVSSGVELDAPQGGTQKGLKSPEKINQFIAAVRRADELLSKS
ncbi:MAG: phosphoribosylanthranilate isomerase [Brachymonas sp.]|nr:phosphoribosylanthranilate isomerase [Brachymonas sp.]